MTTPHSSDSPTAAERPHVTFEFEGTRVTAAAGQSIAGALHQTGVRTLSRSVKYHTPRGYTCGFGACGDCPLTVNGMPGTVSCVTPAGEGMTVSREQGLPSTGFDLLRAADLMRPWLGSGFQFSLFARQPRLSKLAGKLLAILAGGGRMPTPAAAQAARVTRVTELPVPVAVVGGGISGLTAALTASALGQSVVVIDRDFTGGRSSVRTEAITQGAQRIDPIVTYAELLQAAESDSNITLLPGTAIGWIDACLPVIHGTHRTEVRPERVVIATGSYETPLLFTHHDRPGVMLADAALKLAECEGVRPGRRAVIVSAHPRSTEVAARLEACGVHIVDTVEAPSVRRVTGWGKVRGVKLRTADGKRRTLRADLVVSVGPRRATDELALHIAYAEAGTHERVNSDDVSPLGPVTRVGTAESAGAYELDAVREATTRLITPPSPPYSPGSPG